MILRLIDDTHPLQPLARHAERQLRREGHVLCVTSQNCIEFWNVATRPASRNGLGLLPARVDVDLAFIEQSFTVLPDISSIYPLWRQLVVDYGVSGVQVHDAHLVASMLAHGVRHILTFNTVDFVRYAGAGIVVASPENF